MRMQAYLLDVGNCIINSVLDIAFEEPFMEILGVAWWAMGLIVIGVLFSLILLAYLMCYHFIRVEAEIYKTRIDLDPNYLESTSLESAYVEPTDLYVPVILVRKRYTFWSALATWTYGILVIVCGGVYIISRYPWAPPSPFWLGFTLTAFIFAAAFFTYKTWRKERGERVKAKKKRVNESRLEDAFLRVYFYAFISYFIWSGLGVYLCFPHLLYL